MKKKLLETLPVQQAKQKSEKLVGKALTVGEYLIIDLYRDGNHKERYVMNTETGEYASRTAAGIWRKRKFLRAIGGDPVWQSYCSPGVCEKMIWDSKADEETANSKLNIRNGHKAACLQALGYLEDQYDKERRLRTKENKYKKVERMMEEIPPASEDFRTWIYEKCSRERFLFYEKTTKTYGCSNCGEQTPEKDFPVKLRHGERAECPKCAATAVVKKRQKEVCTKLRVCSMERVKPEYGVARHFRVEICQHGKGHEVYLEEGVRILLYDRDYDPRGYLIFYNQDGGGHEWWTGLTRPDWWTRNPRNKRTGTCFLYPEGIREALKNTGYENMTRPFITMAEKNLEADYNAAMAAGYRSDKFARVLEYLVKGRFYRLCRETTEKCWAHNGSYIGSLNLYGETIGEVMGLTDKQKINRIREEDLGYRGLEWMQYSEKHRCKVSEKNLIFLEVNWISPKEIEELPEEIRSRMSIERIINYIKSQVGKDYKTAKSVLSQWGDYLSMCSALGKNLDEELFYKPKDLKLRHDQVVTDKQKLEIVKRMSEDPEQRQQEAQKMEEKFPQTTMVMREIKEKYEFSADGFRMIMPQTPVEIVREGFALHHCAGSSERYFNRIENRETYIGFLRREEEPDIPFYTIEFEPGGTIRQNRSYYDEEPGIEEIRGFLKLWQKEIRKRMTREDKEHARRSAVLREENIRELQENNNTFVLKKLMEDFMEAV